MQLLAQSIPHSKTRKMGLHRSSPALSYHVSNILSAVHSKFNSGVFDRTNGLMAKSNSTKALGIEWIWGETEA